MIARIGLAAAAAFVTVNIWTGAPLVALWVGSQAAGPSGLSMTAVFVVVVVLAVLVLAAHAAADAHQRRATTASPAASPTAASRRGCARCAASARTYVRARQGTSAIERVVVLAVAARRARLQRVVLLLRRLVDGSADATPAPAAPHVAPAGWQSPRARPQRRAADGALEVAGERTGVSPPGSARSRARAGRSSSQAITPPSAASAAAAAIAMWKPSVIAAGS